MTALFLNHCYQDYRSEGSLYGHRAPLRQLNIYNGSVSLAISRYLVRTCGGFKLISPDQQRFIPPITKLHHFVLRRVNVKWIPDWGFFQWVDFGIYYYKCNRICFDKEILYCILYQGVVRFGSNIRKAKKQILLKFVNVLKKDVFQLYIFVLYLMIIN